jgi:hypothetical protein
MMRTMEEEGDRHHIQQERMKEEMHRLEEHDRIMRDQEPVRDFQRER